jgi:crossover junction endodeoxyribonuclease RuvC
VKPALRVIGVDTSLRSTGIGIVEARGNQFVALAHTVIKNPASRPHTACLAHLQQTLQGLLAEYQPAVAAVEGVFFSKNARTAMVLGQARGVVLAACALADLEVFEYAPRSVKQAVVGNGNAHKEQMIKMVTLLLGLPEAPPEDAADALGLALCHLQGRNRPAGLSGKPI